MCQRFHEYQICANTLQGLDKYPMCANMQQGFHEYQICDNMLGFLRISNMRQLQGYHEYQICANILGFPRISNMIGFPQILNMPKYVRVIKSMLVFPLSNAHSIVHTCAHLRKYGIIVHTCSQKYAHINKGCSCKNLVKNIKIYLNQAIKL